MQRRGATAVASQAPQWCSTGGADAKFSLKKKEFQTRANSSLNEETTRKSKCFCSDESYIYGRDLSLGNYTSYGTYSGVSLPSSQMYAKVNKKVKKDLNFGEVNGALQSSATTEKEKVNENVEGNNIQRPWSELKKRNFTLEEILSLETKNQFLEPKSTGDDPPDSKEEGYKSYALSPYNSSISAVPIPLYSCSSTSHPTEAMSIYSFLPNSQASTFYTGGGQFYIVMQLNINKER